MKTLRSIQSLRALAALAVVTYHAGQWVLSPVAVGSGGVDIFFVISGFVMWTSTWNRQVTPGQFLWRRAVRVAPLYWVATLAVAAFALAAPGVLPHVTPEAWHILKSLLFLQHHNPEGDLFPLLAQGWTLNYEAAFYLIFAAGLVLPQPYRLAWLAGTLGPLSCFGLLYLPAYPFGANPMLMQFLGGCLIGRLSIDRALPSRRTGLILVALGLIGFALTHPMGVVPDSLLRPLWWGAPAFALVLGAVAVEAEGGWKPWPGVMALGDASYSIYLVHTPLIAIWNRLIGPTQSLFFFSVAVTVSIIAGLAVHRFIERPLLAALRRGQGASAPDPVPANLKQVGRGQTGSSL